MGRAAFDQMIPEREVIRFVVGEEQYRKKESGRELMASVVLRTRERLAKKTTSELMSDSLDSIHDPVKLSKSDG